jgi:hypothetical protein
VAAQFPRAQVVDVANGGHVTAFGSCVRDIVNRFIATAAKVDASCAGQFTPTYGVGRFARRAAEADAPPADQGDRSCRLDRQVAGMAWAAAYDAWQRSFRMSGPEGVGLRGGTFTADGGDFSFAGVRFAGDVAISGQMRVDSGQLVADLIVDGPGGEDGSLHIAGQVSPHTAPLPARGAIGGRRVSVRLPTA